jgi:hypothetical protein
MLNRLRIAAALLTAIVALCGLLHSATAGAQGVPRGSVANATFTSGVSDGAPVDFRQEFFSSAAVVYFYAEMLDLAGQTVRHRWSREGTLVQEVPIAVTQARQPVWSSLAMQPDWTGNWIVEVLDAAGAVIGRSNFAYNPM